jgi:hypothetical protein
MVEKQVRPNWLRKLVISGRVWACRGWKGISSTFEELVTTGKEVTTPLVRLSPP